MPTRRISPRKTRYRKGAETMTTETLTSVEVEELRREVGRLRLALKVAVLQTGRSLKIDSKSAAEARKVDLTLIPIDGGQLWSISRRQGQLEPTDTECTPT